MYERERKRAGEREREREGERERERERGREGEREGGRERERSSLAPHRSPPRNAPPKLCSDTCRKNCFTLCTTPRS